MTQPDRGRCALLQANFCGHHAGHLTATPPESFVELVGVDLTGHADRNPLSGSERERQGWHTPRVLRSLRLDPLGATPPGRAHMHDMRVIFIGILAG